jgi:quinol monooxygenase YgiN
MRNLPPRLTAGPTPVHGRLRIQSSTLCRSPESCASESPPLAHAESKPPTHASVKKNCAMYGLIGKMTAVAGERDKLAAILIEGTRAMPGCLSYVVGIDSAEPDALWITEVWESQESHQASIALPAVQAAITKGRPLIAGLSHRVETRPLGDFALAAALNGRE